MSQNYAAAIGEEFAGKGANGILGPSVDVHRVARNGRNFEYLSGEDPYLGSRMAEAYVVGVQSKGVFAVIKHWIFNTQENNRENSSSVVDERSAHELYYPPFEAAIKAGASAVMCSYNRINGTYSCENEDTLNRVLRQQLGFRGFVQSDWWAVRSMSLAQGLDQEMPGEGINVYFRNESLTKAKMPHHVEIAVLRILAVIYHMRLPETSKCTPPHCREWHVANVSSTAHVALAEKIAADSVVMLKNEVNTLPLRPPHSGGPRTIAVIGSAAEAKPFDPENVGQGHGDWATGDYYSGGGSGHVVAGRVVTPLDGIWRRAQAAGVEVFASPTNNIKEAVLVSQSADVLVVVVATTSGESRDRRSLHLDSDADELITTLSLVHSDKRIIVLMQVPGAVVMPWRDSVDCILAMFLGGQETGGAWASVLFGDVSPSGRLPLTMPATDDGDIKPAPGNSDAVFSEALATGYRSTKLKVAFPFGHGLSYSTFSYGSLGEVPCGEVLKQSEALLCLRVRVTNSGSAVARTVAQLYLGFPPEAGYPRALLRGFVKTPPMHPSESKAIVFALTSRDLSYYSVSRGWLMPAHVNASVGESSADLRQSLNVAKIPASVPNLAPAPAPTATSVTSPTTETTTILTTAVGEEIQVLKDKLKTNGSSGNIRESSVVIMSRRFSFPDVGKIAKDMWSKTHIGEQLGSWEQNRSSRMLAQPLPRAWGVHSGWSWRAVGLFLASASLASVTLFVLSTRCACHRCRSGAQPEEELVEMELVEDDVRDRLPEGSEEEFVEMELVEDDVRDRLPAVPSTKPSSRTPFMTSS